MNHKRAGYRKYMTKKHNQWVIGWVIEDFRQRPEKVGKLISSGTLSVSGPRVVPPDLP